MPAEQIRAIANIDIMAAASATSSRSALTAYVIARRVDAAARAGQAAAMTKCASIFFLTRYVGILIALLIGSSSLAPVPAHAPTNRARSIRRAHITHVKTWATTLALATVAAPGMPAHVPKLYQPQEVTTIKSCPTVTSRTFTFRKWHHKLSVQLHILYQVTQGCVSTPTPQGLSPIQVLIGSRLFQLPNILNMRVMLLQ